MSTVAPSLPQSCFLTLSSRQASWLKLKADEGIKGRLGTKSTSTNDIVINGDKVEFRLFGTDPYDTTSDSAYKSTYYFGKESASIILPKNGGYFSIGKGKGSDYNALRLGSDYVNIGNCNSMGDLSEYKVNVNSKGVTWSNHGNDFKVQLYRDDTSETAKEPAFRIKGYDDLDCQFHEDKISLKNGNMINLRSDQVNLISLDGTRTKNLWEGENAIPQFYSNHDNIWHKGILYIENQTTPPFIKMDLSWAVADIEINADGEMNDSDAGDSAITLKGGAIALYYKNLALRPTGNNGSTSYNNIYLFTPDGKRALTLRSPYIATKTEYGFVKAAVDDVAELAETATSSEIVQAFNKLLGNLRSAGLLVK